MGVGARPLREREFEAICDRKMADFRHKAPRLAVFHLDPDVFFDAASDDSDIRLAVDTGFITTISDGLRDPVLVRMDDREVFTCPALALKVLADEPPEIHRAFVEGAFMRKLFRFFVPAAFEGGEPWEVADQVREIMQRHFAFQLIACESVLAEAA
ncbi:MAG: hypothetical protein ACRDKJ_06375 [Actinomycetota bacterium]